MEYSLTGKEQERVGNRDGRHAPHNVFRCEGEEKWVAISVETDAQFGALAAAAGHPEWADDSRFSSIEARLSNQDALETLLQQWTAKLGAGETAAALQAAGVPSAPVLDTAEVMSDPHLVERGFIAPVDHPVVGARPIPTLPWNTDGRRTEGLRPAPLFGEHTSWVLKELLQVPDQEYERLLSSGAIG